VHSEQGKQHKTFYPIKNFPYVAIIDPLTGERVQQWNIVIEPGDFIAACLDYINDPKPAPAKAKKRPKVLFSNAGICNDVGG
jgi:UBX domain-containing protein 7